MVNRKLEERKGEHEKKIKNESFRLGNLRGAHLRKERLKGKT